MGWRLKNSNRVGGQIVENNYQKQITQHINESKGCQF